MSDLDDVIITRSRYEELVRSENMLRHLEGTGVDNWEGYSHPDDEDE